MQITLAEHHLYWIEELRKLENLLSALDELNMDDNTIYDDTLEEARILRQRLTTAMIALVSEAA